MPAGCRNAKTTIAGPQIGRESGGGHLKQFSVEIKTLNFFRESGRQERHLKSIPT